MNLMTRFLAWLASFVEHASDHPCEDCGGPVRSIELHYVRAMRCKACGRRQKEN